MSTLTLRHGTPRIRGFGFTSGAQAPRRNRVAADGGPRKSKRSPHGSAPFEGKLAFTTMLWTPTGRSVRCTLWRKSSRTSLNS
jgi:hypothetical protein